MNLHVIVTDAHIAAARPGAHLAARPGSSLTPVSRALSEAVFPDGGRDVLLHKGPSLSLPRDTMALPSSMDDAVSFFLFWPMPPTELERTKGIDIRLPRCAQIFLNVWNAGPSGGARFVIHDDAGDVVGRRSYCEIITPFSFLLAVPDTPFYLPPPKEKFPGEL